MWADILTSICSSIWCLPRFRLMPIPRYSLHRLRHWIALPIGFALFWHDTWLPGPGSIKPGFAGGGLSTDYLIDLVTRFINWQMIGAIFVLLVACLFLSQSIRITVFVVAILLWLNVTYPGGTKFLLVANRTTDDHCNNDGW
ncbi:cellulose biosynthesis protein BcsG [Shigella flexneri]